MSNGPDPRRTATLDRLVPDEKLMHAPAANDLCNRFQTVAKNDPQVETYGQLIRAAYAIAYQSHGDQTRDSGEPYITHPVAVATILLDLAIGAETVIAALLHDVIEDTDISYEQIADYFGEEIASLVDGVQAVGAGSAPQRRGPSRKLSQNVRLDGQ